MRITVFGATGNVGRRVVTEAATRGHDVVAPVRDPARAAAFPGTVEVVRGNVEVVGDVALACRASDVAIAAVRPPPGLEDTLVGATEALLAGVARAGVRLVLVGGAGSLTVPDTDGLTVLEDPRYLDPAFRSIALANVGQLEACRRQDRVPWTYVSPPAALRPGQRTGRYRLGTDTLLVDRAGRSTISLEDLAVAILDEVEAPRHDRRRFTVAEAEDIDPLL